MGFDVSYKSTETISPKLQREVIDELRVLSNCHSWVRVICPNLVDESGYLSGNSRLSPTAEPDDADDARRDGAPDGTMSDLMNILCELSRQFDIEWEVEHDYSEGVLGSIRYGVADDAVREFVEGYDIFLDGTDDDGFEIPDDI
jgi:hypothetical protein